MDWSKAARSLVRQVEETHLEPRVRELAQEVGVSMDQIPGTFLCLKASGSARVGRTFHAARISPLLLNNRQMAQGIWLDTCMAGGVALDALLNPEVWRRLS